MKICDIMKEVKDKEKLERIICDAFHDLKMLDEKCYHEYKHELYILVHGHHFTEETYHKAVKHMINNDGSYGGHFNMKQVEDLLHQHNIKFEHYNIYDICYVMNMEYSDNYHIFGNDATSYLKLTKAFLEDVDAPEGKAYRYYIAMKK